SGSGCGAERYGAGRAGAELSRVQLVATDLDGTLLDPSGEVTERTAKAVATARAAGIHVVPITGRPPQAMWHLAEQAGLGPFGVCSNGAAIVDLDSRSVLEVEPIAGDIADGLVDLLRSELPEVLLACDDLDFFIYERGFFPAPVDWDEEMREVEDIRPAVRAGCVKLIARSPDHSASQLIEFLEDHLAELAHVTTSGLDWVDIGALQVSKAYAMQRLCDRLGVHLGEVIAVGDNHNDLSVLAWAGISMAPANAIPEVLAVAHRVLPANGEDGVAELLEELAALRLG
ncbi:MAG TPA: Cof-type HAD-IIB family hydrolase, partial [Acidimicrobiales bacterium]|nr:Cof-type HAD-IIB family hydrolase [Acidimicrobiales bacterium]